MNSEECPCGSGYLYQHCCKPYHQRIKAAPTAEALMRSRYSAYLLKNAKYLYKTWDESTRPRLQSLKAMPATDWIGLKILSIGQGAELDEEATVEFEARYITAGQVYSMHEVSRFRRVNKQWVYIDGEVENTSDGI